MNPSIFAFLDFLRGNHQHDAGPLGLQIQDLCEAELQADPNKIYQLWVDLASSLLVDKFKVCHSFLTGVISLPLVPCDDFLQRKALPVGTKIEWPSGFNIQVFASKYFSASPFSEMRLASGTCKVLPACMLAEIVPLADEVLCIEEGMKKAAKSSCLADLISSASEPAAINTATSTRLARIESDVLSKLPKTFATIKTAQTLVQSSEWKTTLVSEFSRLEAILVTLIQNLGNTVTLFINEATKSLDTAAKAVFDKVMKANKQDGPLLVKMLQICSKSTEVGFALDRLEGDPQKYKAVLTENISDFFYASAKKVCELAQISLRFHQKLTGLVENLPYNHEKELKDLKSLADLKIGSTLTVALVLSDLVATWL